jgi:hypothetical protein
VAGDAAFIVEFLACGGVPLWKGIGVGTHPHKGRCKVNRGSRTQKSQADQ